MIKFLLTLAVVGICALIGFVIYSYIKNRVQLYDEILKLINDFKSEIYFLQTDFTTLLKRQNYGKGVMGLVDSYLKVGQATSVLLKQTESKVVNEFFNSIGKHDVEGELKNLGYYESVFKTEYEKKNVVFNKYGSLVLKLSIIAGALLAIILI